jgi:predicted permease
MDASRLATLLCVVAPVFALIALGRALRRFELLGEAGARELHLLVYWVGLPAQLVWQIAASDLREHVDATALAAALVGYWVAFALAWMFSARLAPEARGCAMNGAVRGNGAFIGLPVALLLAANLPPDQGKRLTSAYLVLLGALVPCYNIGGVLGFLLPRHGVTWHGLKRAALESLINPLLIACAIGVALSLWWPSLLRPGAEHGPPLRAALSALHMLADLAVPLALLIAGAQLDFGLMRRSWRLLGLTTAAKLLGAPLLGYLAGRLLGVEPIALTAVVIITAAPTAMAAVPMARILGGDDRLMAAMVVASTVGAPASLLLWLALLAP